MALVSSATGGQAASQLALQQLRVQQAKQNAERAESAARNLRSQADTAQREADRAQENARSLYVRSDQAAGVAGQARQGLAALKTQGDMQVSLGNTLDQVQQRQGQQPVVQSEPTAESPSQPVVNTAGQVTGRVVNTTA